MKSANCEISWSGFASSLSDSDLSDVACVIEIYVNNRAHVSLGRIGNIRSAFSVWEAIRRAVDGRVLDLANFALVGKLNGHTQ